jgi:hypothetical protein
VGLVALSTTILSQPASAAGARGAPLVLEMAHGSDARNERSVTAAVRLRNVTEEPVFVYLRRDLFTFLVRGPAGEEVTCYPVDTMRHPSRRGFTRVAPHRSVVLTSRLVELCPRWTFAKRGMYLVHARYRPSANGGSVGLDAFTGDLDADRPIAIRVERDAHVFANHVVAAKPAPSIAVKAPSASPAAAQPRRTVPVRR